MNRNIWKLKYNIYRVKWICIKLHSHLYQLICKKLWDHFHISRLLSINWIDLFDLLYLLQVYTLYIFAFLLWLQNKKVLMWKMWAWNTWISCYFVLFRSWNKQSQIWVSARIRVAVRALCGASFWDVPGSLRRHYGVVVHGWMRTSAKDVTSDDAQTGSWSRLVPGTALGGWLARSGSKTGSGRFYKSSSETDTRAHHDSCRGALRRPSDARIRVLLR